MSRLDLLCSWERGAVTRYGLLCFALLWFALFYSSEGKPSHVTICFVLLRFTLHSSALLFCGMTRNKSKAC